MTVDAWKNYVTYVLVPQIIAFRATKGIPQTDWILVTMDGAGTVHCTHPDVLLFLRDNHIHVYKFLAHTSHIRQPLDLAFNGRVQVHFRDRFPAFMASLGKSYSPLYLPRLLHSIYADIAANNVCKSF